MAHKDKYRNFVELLKFEEAGVDYRILQSDRDSDVTILAPHGGAIERRTSEIARAIAGNNFNVYCFEGRKRHCNYATLHITSHHFDEPKCLALLQKSQTVVAVHGSGESGQRVFIGGRDATLVASIAERLRLAGYNVETEEHPHPGRDRMNICNRGGNHEGVQLELTKGLHRDLDVHHFAQAVRQAVASARMR